MAMIFTFQFTHFWTKARKGFLGCSINAFNYQFGHRRAAEQSIMGGRSRPVNALDGGGKSLAPSGLERSFMLITCFLYRDDDKSQL